MTNKDFLLDGEKVVNLPEHYINHPVIGRRLTEVDADELEVDKVVIDNHELPLEQRITLKATVPVLDKSEDKKANAKDIKDND